jgi:hypothetical protein
MRQLERNASNIETLRIALDSLSARIWTALPGIVNSYDATKGTCTVVPSIQGRIRNPDGTHSFVNMPTLQDVPVVYMGGGAFVATFPIQQGDEALVIFADRCIDGWWQMGGVQLPLEPRMHDLSDGFAIIGPRSLARKLTGVSTANAQLRSVDGTTFLELTPGGEANVVAPAGITLTGPVTINGTLALNGASTLTGDMLLNGHLEASGNITAVEEVQGNGIMLSEHIHGGVQPGGGDTSGPIG